METSVTLGWKSHASARKARSQTASSSPARMLPSRRKQCWQLHDKLFVDSLPPGRRVARVTSSVNRLSEEATSEPQS
jgi:hypothetical protein